MKKLVPCLALTVLALSACTTSPEEQKLADCSKVVAVTNQRFFDPQKATSLSEVAQYAGKFEQAAQNLKQLDIRDGKLKQLRDEQANEYQEIGRSLKDTSVAFDAKTSNPNERTRTDLQEASGRLSKALERNVDVSQKLLDYCTK